MGPPLVFSKSFEYPMLAYSISLLSFDAEINPLADTRSVLVFCMDHSPHRGQIGQVDFDWTSRMVANSGPGNYRDDFLSNEVPRTIGYPDGRFLNSLTVTVDCHDLKGACVFEPGTVATITMEMINCRI